jgi:hypothetical protein
MLMFPKSSGLSKKRKKHMESIMQQERGTCYLCVRLHNDYRCWQSRETHHVYDGPNRSVSEANGFTVKLCIPHHRTGTEAVHNDIHTMRLIQADVQREYEKTHTRQQFMQLIGRNYLEEKNNG